MDVRALQCFVAVARHRHFTRAADELYLTQSAVSQQVRRLEAELGAELVTRSPVALTAAGEALFERAVAILAALDDAHAAVTGAARGTVRVSADHPAGLAGAIAAFHRRHPEVRVAVGDGGDVHVGAAPPAGWTATPLEAEPLVCVGAEAPHELLALSGRTIVLPGPPVRGLVEAACAAAGFGPVPVLEADDVAALLALVAAGAGVAVLPASWAPGAPRLLTDVRYAPSVAVRPGAPPAATALAAALQRR